MRLMPPPSLVSKRRIEPLVWLAFSAGGVGAASLLPVLVFLFAFAFPLGWITPADREHLLAVAGHPVTVLVLLGFFVVLLVHSAHRFRFTLYDGLQIKQKGLTALACYGASAAGVVAATVTLLELMDVNLGS